MDVISNSRSNIFWNIPSNILVWFVSVVLAGIFQEFLQKFIQRFPSIFFFQICLYVFSQNIHSFFLSKKLSSESFRNLYRNIFPREYVQKNLLWFVQKFSLDLFRYSSWDFFKVSSRERISSGKKMIISINVRKNVEGGEINEWPKELFGFDMKIWQLLNILSTIPPGNIWSHSLRILPKVSS